MKEMEQNLDLKIPLSETGKLNALERIHGMVRDGTLGEDYTISSRDKNRRLRRDYNIDDRKIKHILLDLQIGDFVKAERSDNPMHPDDIVYIFKKSTMLMPKWQENADYKHVILYIKITWPIENTMMFIISFHEDNI